MPWLSFRVRPAGAMTESRNLPPWGGGVKHQTPRDLLEFFDATFLAAAVRRHSEFRPCSRREPAVRLGRLGRAQPGPRQKAREQGFPSFPSRARRWRILEWRIGT